MMWIPISERLPPAEGWYLALSKRTNGAWSNPEAVLYMNGIWFTHFKVVAWMPIPKYPEV